MPNPPQPHRSVLILGLITGISAASTAAIFIKLAQASGTSSILIATLRLTIASIILVPLVLTKHRMSFKNLKKKEWIQASLSGFFLAIHFASWIASLQYTSVVSSVFMVTTTPIWVALCSFLFLGEKIKKIAILGLGIALCGGIFIGLSDSCAWENWAFTCASIGNPVTGKNVLGNLLALSGAWMAAGYFLVGRKLRASIPLVPYVFIVYSMASAFLLIIMVMTKANPFTLSPTSYLWCILLALVPQLFGHTIFNWALKYLPASLVSIALLGEPIGSTALAYVIFLEVPGVIKILGAVLLLVGIGLAGKSDQKKMDQN